MKLDRYQLGIECSVLGLPFGPLPDESFRLAVASWPAELRDRAADVIAGGGEVESPTTPGVYYRGPLQQRLEL